MPIKVIYRVKPKENKIRALRGETQSWYGVFEVEDSPSLLPHTEVLDGELILDASKKASEVTAEYSSSAILKEITIRKTVDKFFYILFAVSILALLVLTFFTWYTSPTSQNSRYIECYQNFEDIQNKTHFNLQIN